MKQLNHNDSTSIITLDSKTEQKQSFEHFIKLTEMKRYRRLLEKRLKKQYLQERKDRSLNKTKIIPPNM